jgi:prevent-host-death family protein
MTKVTIHVAKTNLSKLIAKVEAGEEVVICRGDKEVAKLVPAAAPSRKSGVREKQAAWEESVGARRKPGSMNGKIVIHDSFYDPWSAKDFNPGIMDDDPDWGEPGVWDGKTPRKPGSMRGEITLDDSFFDPLTDEEMGLSGEGDEETKP